MKRPITPAYTFDPGSATLTLSGIAGFDLRNLFAVIDLRTGALVYAPMAGYGVTAQSGATLTLAAPMAGLAAADPLMILYDDGGRPAEDASLQAVTAAVGGLHADLSTLHADVGTTLHGDLAAILARLGTKLSVSIDGDSVTLTLPNGLALDTSVQALAASLATLHADLQAILADLNTGLAHDNTALAAVTTTATWQANLLAATQAVTAAIRAQIDIAPLFVTDGTSTFVRRERVNEGTGVITVEFEAMDGSAASPAVATLSPIAGRSKVATPVYYDVVVAASGYALTDTLAEVVITDTSSGAITATWQNLTQATTLSGPPPSANVRRSASTVTFATGQQPAANSLSVVLSTDGPFATNFGQQGDAPATSDGGSFSLMALTKRGLQRLTSLLGLLPASLGQKAMAAAFPVAIASDQSAVPVSGSVTVGGALTANQGAAGAAAWPVSFSGQSVGVTALPALPAGGNVIGGVTIGKAATAGDAAITAGGTAQMLFAGATPPNGWKVANPDPAEDLWVSDSATAAPNGLGSYRIPAGGIVTTEPGERPCGPVSVYGASTSHPVTARSW